MVLIRPADFRSNRDYTLSREEESRREKTEPGEGETLNKEGKVVNRDGKVVYLDEVVDQVKEFWTWHRTLVPDNMNPSRMTDTKILPFPVTRERKAPVPREVSNGEKVYDLREKEMNFDDPKIMLSFDPIVACLVFWKMMKELERQGWEFPKFEPVMRLMDWILVLGEYFMEGRI